MRKFYIQPEAELLNLALLEDFLAASNDEPTDEDVTIGGNGTVGGGEGGSDNNDAGDSWIDGSQTPGAGGNQTGGDEWDDGEYDPYA